MSENSTDKIDVIKDAAYLDELIATGWTVVGPRGDGGKDLKALARFFKRGIEVFPEQLLADDGFEIVPPSTFTKNHQLMFKDEGTLIRYTMTQYKLARGGEELNLYVLLDEENAEF
ncbi:MAG: hypothetical protein JRF63_04510 [Deltaproteobacteria bacterium]|nr:hypothetical protein [Deltaproteobacteria bacterium]